MIIVVRRYDFRAKTVAFALCQSEVCRKKKPAVQVSKLASGLRSMSFTCTVAGPSSHNILCQTSTLTVQTPAEAEPGTTTRSKMVMNEGSGAESQYFKSKRGVLLSLLMQADKRRKVDFIGGP